MCRMTNKPPPLAHQVFPSPEAGGPCLPSCTVPGETPGADGETETLEGPWAGFSTSPAGIVTSALF